jgi:hypothetical protein
MTQAGKQRYDPFVDGDLTEELAAFKPKSASELSPRPEPAEMRRIAAARGFEERPLVATPTSKEPLKALQFRLPQSQVERFHQLAFQAFGLAHGAKTALFLKMWETYVKDAEDNQEKDPP